MLFELKIVCIFSNVKGDNDKERRYKILKAEKNIGMTKSLIYWLTDKSKHCNNLNKQNGRGNFILISGRGEFKLKVLCHLMIQFKIYREVIIILYILLVQYEYSIKLQRIKAIFTRTQ